MKQITMALLAFSLAGFGRLDAQNAVQSQPPAGNRGPGAAAPVQAAGEIRGTVVDAENKAAIASASVAVRRQSDSTLVAGAIVRPDGSFRIEGLRPGAYILRVTMIGYKTQVTPALTITAGAAPNVVGSIALTRS